MPEPAQTDVLIVGAGFAGLAMAIKLGQAGLNEFILIEKAGDVGGTWRDNHYPGCACDIPSHLYSLSFEPKTDWSRMYPRQPELLAYLRGVAARHGLARRIRFNTVMTAAAWDGAANRWQVETSTGPISARVLVSATGGLHIPSLPKLPGLADFAGPAFHSAQWDHGFDFAGKRVAVIGTGASAVQFIPEIAPQVAELDVYQRTPAWVVPKLDPAFTAKRQSLFARLPFYRALFRKYLFLVHDVRVLAFLGNLRMRKLARDLALRNIKRSIKDPDLREKLTPTYEVGCKRLMISSDYYPALARPNVTLITEPIARVTRHGIIDRQGVERPADAIIFGTGFEVTTAYHHVRITGAGGVSLADLWDRTGMRAYQGINVAGFPNYFMLLGPHTALGHNSVVIMIEAQVGFIISALRQMRARGIAAIDVLPAAQARFIGGLQTRLNGSVWQDGNCDSWYKDAHGQVTTIWPGSAAAYQKSVRRANLRDYALLTTQMQQLAA